MRFKSGDLNTVLESRTRYDLSHFTFMVGNIGQLQTLSVIPVVAGDSMELSFAGVFRLSPLRRNMQLDCMVDLFLFYIPHRHIYGSDWTNMFIQGQDNTVTFGAHTLTGASQIFGTHTLAGENVALWLTQGYLNIFNRYFKHPSSADYIASHFDAMPDGDSRLQYGLRCGFPRRAWNSAVDAEVTTADYRFSLVATDKIDLLQMATTKGLLKSERRREFFAHRYNEIINAQWGSSVNTDADQRAELCMHCTGYVAGSDVMGTDDVTLGKYTGVAKSLSGCHMPMKFFPEHGALWLMALLRFPAVHTLETGYLHSKSSPTYAQIAGDPEQIKNTAPQVLNLGEWLKGSALSDAGIQPYAQWYREMHNRVHSKYRSVAGHPFVEGLFSLADDLKYIPISEYADVFQSEEMAQWQVSGRVNLIADRVIPEVSTSIFAGTT